VRSARQALVILLGCAWALLTAAPRALALDGRADARVQAIGSSDGTALVSASRGGKSHGALDTPRLDPPILVGPPAPLQFPAQVLADRPADQARLLFVLARPRAPRAPPSPQS